MTWADALHTVCSKEHISVAGMAAVEASPKPPALPSPPKPPRSVRRNFFPTAEVADGDVDDDSIVVVAGPSASVARGAGGGESSVSPRVRFALVLSG